MTLEHDIATRPEEPAPSAAATPRAGGPPLWVRLPLAAVAGVALALAFAPYDLVWMTPFAAAALTVLCRGIGLRRAASVGFVFGLAFFLVLLKWLDVTGVDALVSTAVIEALFMAALGAGLALVTRLPFWPAWAAALWVGAELARAHVPFGGFPWGRLAFALDDSPLAGYAALGGAPLVTFAVVLAGNLALRAVLGRGWATDRAFDRRDVLGRIVAGCVGFAVAFGGLLVPLPTDGSSTATVAIVQGNVPARGLHFLGRARTVTNNHVAATEELMQGVDAGRYPRPDFVLWPENSTDIDPFEDPITGDAVESAVRTAGVPVLVGAVLDGPGPNQRRTTGVVWDPKTGPGEVYVKRHPVPFGEYIPLRNLLLPYIDRLQMVGRDTYAGDEPGLLQIAGVTVGDVICFEIAYDEIVQDVARRDSQLLVVQTNNSTFLGSGQPEQQFAITRLRAIEYGRSTLVASPSGISGVIAPDGTVVRKSREATRQIYVERVPLRTARTVAAVVGSLPEYTLAGLGILAVALALVRRRRSASDDRVRP